jgi:subtilase family serine protease
MMLVLLSALTPKSQAQIFVQDRISNAIESSNMSPMRGTIHPMARPEFDQGLVDNAKTIEGMAIHFKRTEAQEADLQSLLQAQQTPGSASYHKWLTQAQFGQRFGMSASDLASVSAWLQQEGFTVTGVAESSNSIRFKGSVASIERAFQTQIHKYVVNGETHFANSTQISLPNALAGIVSNVRGLDDFHLKAKVQPAKSRALAAHFTGGINGQHYLAPGDIGVIYDISPLYNAGNTGKGATIAVIGQTAIELADITDFRAAAGLTVNPPTVVTVPGTTPPTAAAGAATGDLSETDLDLEWSGGVAPAASIVLVNSDDVRVSLEYAIENSINGITIPIITQSYGSCEVNYPTSEVTEIDSALAQANTQGQTVFLASGDTGAADCDDSGDPNNPIQSATLGLAVDYPGSSVYVTDVGGNEFMGDGTILSPQTGAGTYWNATGGGSASDDLVTSAKSYIPEMTWNDTTYSIDNNGGFSASGGGASLLFTKPSWQAGITGIPADGKRDVPDVSLDASPNHDSYLYCTQVLTVGSPSTYVSSCQATSFRLSDPGQSDDSTFAALAGGTSFAAPEFAGILAVIEQKLGATGGLGNINPALYSMAAVANTYSAAFHDVKTGNNQVPCTNGSPNCATSGSNNVIGFSAGTGYDQVTGLGSVDVNNLATAFSTAKLLTATTTTLTFSPASPTVVTPVTFTATVKAETGTTALTGAVTFTVDGAAPKAGSALTNGVSTFTTSFSTGGPHTVVAFYAGDANSFSSTSSKTVSVLASGIATTTTTLTANPTSLALAGALTLTATVNSTTAGTVAGTVTFTIGSTPVGSAPIVAGSSGVGTATLSTTATGTEGFVVGTNSVVASYGGDSNYAASTSSPVVVTITNPSIMVSATNVTISSSKPGNSGTSTITLTSTGGYAGTAVVSAAGTVNVDYGFGGSGASTANVALTSGGTGSTTITLTTTTASGNLQKGAKGNFKKTVARVGAAGGTLAGCLLLLLIPGIRKKRWPAALAMLVFLSVGAGLGCGGGAGGGAPSGTYTITITAVDSSNSAITGTGTFTVTIQ